MPWKECGFVLGEHDKLLFLLIPLPHGSIRFLYLVRGQNLLLVSTGNMSKTHLFATTFCGGFLKIDIMLLSIEQTDFLNQKNYLQSRARASIYPTINN